MWRGHANKRGKNHRYSTSGSSATQQTYIPVPLLALTHSYEPRIIRVVQMIKYYYSTIGVPEAWLRKRMLPLPFRLTGDHGTARN